jgi:hypothetical protein
MFFHRLGELRDQRFENQVYRASGLNLLVAAVILWNTRYLAEAFSGFGSRAAPDIRWRSDRYCQLARRRYRRRSASRLHQRRHDLARLAIPALWHLQRLPSRLHCRAIPTCSCALGSRSPISDSQNRAHRDAGNVPEQGG